MIQRIDVSTTLDGLFELVKHSEDSGNGFGIFDMAFDDHGDYPVQGQGMDFYNFVEI